MAHEMEHTVIFSAAAALLADKNFWFQIYLFKP